MKVLFFICCFFPALSQADIVSHARALALLDSSIEDKRQDVNRIQQQLARCRSHSCRLGARTQLRAPQADLDRLMKRKRLLLNQKASIPKIPKYPTAASFLPWNAAEDSAANVKNQVQVNGAEETSQKKSLSSAANQKQESAKNKVQKQKKQTLLWGAANGVASKVFFMKAKAAFAVAAKNTSAANFLRSNSRASEAPPYDAVAAEKTALGATLTKFGIATAVTAGALAVNYLRLKKKQNKLSATLNSNSNVKIKCTTSECLEGQQISATLADETFSAKHKQKKISKILGCKEECVKIAPDGSLRFNPAISNLIGCGGPDCKDILKRPLDLNNLNPKNKSLVKKIMDGLKKRNPKFFAAVENAGEDLETGSDSVTKKAEALPKDERSLAGSIGNEGIAPDRNPNSFKKFKSLFDQFKNGKEFLSKKSITVGQDQVGVAQDNIFLMVNRRYKERRKSKQFIEGLNHLLSSSREKI